MKKILSILALLAIALPAYGAWQSGYGQEDNDRRDERGREMKRGGREFGGRPGEERGREMKRGGKEFGGRPGEERGRMKPFGRERGGEKQNGWQEKKRKKEKKKRRR